MSKSVPALSGPPSLHLLWGNDQTLADCKDQIFQSIALTNQEQSGHLLEKMKLLSPENLHELHQNVLKVSADRILFIERETGKKCKALGTAKKHLALGAVHLAFLGGLIKVGMALARKTKIFSTPLIICAVALAALHIIGLWLSSLYLLSKAAHLALRLTEKKMIDRAQGAATLISEQLITALFVSSKDEKSRLQQSVQQLTELTGQQSSTMAHRATEIASLKIKISSGKKILSRQKEAARAIQPLVEHTLNSGSQISEDPSENSAESSPLPRKADHSLKQALINTTSDGQRIAAQKDQPVRPQINAQDSNRALGSSKPDLAALIKDSPIDKSEPLSLPDDLY